MLTSTANQNVHAGHMAYFLFSQTFRIMLCSCRPAGLRMCSLGDVEGGSLMYFTRPFWLLPVYYSTSGGYWDRFRVCVQYMSVPKNSEVWTKAEPTNDYSSWQLNYRQAGLTWNHAGVKCANIFADLVVLSIFRTYKSSTRFILPLDWSSELAWNWKSLKRAGLARKI